MAARRRPRREAEVPVTVYYTLTSEPANNILNNLEHAAMPMKLALLRRLHRSILQQGPLAAESVAERLCDFAADLMPQATNVQVAAALIGAARLTTDAYGEAETRGREIARALRGEDDGGARTTLEHFVAIGDVLDGE
jgi:hypothetical protein